MIHDALTNPPMPEWNDLRNEERSRIKEALEVGHCPHCMVSAAHDYGEIRQALLEREKRIFRATMESV